MGFSVHELRQALDAYALPGGELPSVGELACMQSAWNDHKGQIHQSYWPVIESRMSIVVRKVNPPGNPNEHIGLEDS